jgi:hypothetical protein
MKIIISVLILLHSIVISPQSIRERNAALVPQGYGIELLNSDGCSGIINDVSNISSMNPASIYKLENLSLGLSYQFQTNLDTAWIAGIGTSRVQNYIPQSFGGVIHYENFSFGIGFSQKYNGSLDIGPIEITTVTNPDGTGEYYYPDFQNTIHSYTLSAAYQFREVFAENTNLSIGFTYLLNNFHSRESIGTVTANASALGSNFELGVHYDIKINDEQHLSLGTSYTTSTIISDEVEYEGTSTIIPGSIPGDSSNYQLIASSYSLLLNVPSELSFDIYFKPLLNLEFLGRINNIFWDDNADNVKDQLEISTTAVYSFSPTTKASFGLYYTGKDYIEDYFNINEDLYALYFLGGFSFQINFLKVDLAVADSHLFSGDFWKQTIGKIGFGIQL